VRISRQGLPCLALAAFLLAAASPAAQDTGSIRGVVTDLDFGVPLPSVLVTAVGTGRTTTTTDQGTFLLGGLAPGKYTLLFSKEGYLRLVRADVPVLAGQLTDLDAAMGGEFTDMEEFIVEDILRAASGTEAALLELRLESPALLDSISADLMSRAGASDAAAGLRLVAGATVADGKTAVIRGLPDRYVSSQLNGVRLPSADEDKRAVELDQFPSAVIESIQVSKTFTPDQQGDASGGAVDVRLRGIPDETILRFKAQYSYNSNVAGSDDFLGYDGGGISFWGSDDGDRDVQTENLGQSWTGAVGVSEDDTPIDYKWSLDAGKRFELSNGVTLGGFATFFYERDSSFYDDGKNDSLWVDDIGEDLTPETIQGTPTDGNFKTALLDVTQASQSVQWGGLATLGLETDTTKLGLSFLYTRTAEDKATFAEDTRGKEFFFPGYDPDDPNAPGNDSSGRFAAPYNRNETLEYTERATDSLQLYGAHELPLEPRKIGPFTFQRPELSWLAAKSSASLDQPDKRQFGSVFLPESFNPALGATEDPLWIAFFPSSNVNLGNVQHIFKTIEEDSTEYAVDLKLPFEQWDSEQGYLKLGIFSDKVDRSFDQDTYSNFGDFGAQFPGTFDQFWSEFFPGEDHPITQSEFDIDYEGDIDVSASYAMLDLPLSRPFSVVGGVRFESTDIRIVNFPGQFAYWYPPDLTQQIDLEPGDADVDFSQRDALPSIGFEYEPLERLILRGSYSETIARQTFKELTPIVQQEFAGGPIFIGNPDLQMSALQNYDLRLDYTPYEGGFASLSWFHKDVDDPIEYVQRLVDFTFTTAVNYPRGQLDGYEVELRQDLGHFREGLQGLALGANATFIDSEVQLTEDEIREFETIGVPRTSRDMTNAPAYLYNLYLTYDVEHLGAQFAAFYTYQGDTLVTGGGTNLGNFVPDVYAKGYGTLNMSATWRLTKHASLRFEAKNLTDPAIEEVYRSEFISGDQTRTSYTKGREFSIGFSVNL
jgi:outer membrane receptor protein involved in Fe transport